LFFGQIKKVKGLDLLLKALPEVVNKHPKVLVVIAGKVWKDDYSAYRKIIEESGLQDYCIERIHYISNEEVPLYFASADLVVLPYRKIYQSGVLLMAMSYAKPVLAADLDGMREIIRDNETGFLFRQGNARALSERIQQVLQNPAEMDRIALKGYEHVRSNFSWEGIGARTAECYNLS
jgi:glycosyltransferase involved in cell wall biosynthesis